MTLNTRKYNIPDATLLQHASVVLETLPDDIDTFAAFDSAFGPNTLTTLQAHLEAARTIASGDVIGNQLMQLTDQVNEAMVASNRTYRQIAYFVRKAFPGQDGIRKEFGSNQVAQVRQNQARMIRFMQFLCSAVDKYRAQLEAAGAPAELLDRAVTQRDALIAADDAQEKFKRSRGVETDARIAAFNTLFDTSRQIAAAARIVYADNEAHRRKYRLPRPSGSTSSPDDLLLMDPEIDSAPDDLEPSEPAA